MKRTILISAFFLIFLPCSRAFVYEKNNPVAENIIQGIPAFNLDSMDIRINGKNAGLKRYESKVPVKKILDAYLAKAEKEGGAPVNNRYLWLAANALFKGTGSGFEAESFGYIFTEDKKGNSVFVVAGGAGDYTEIIKAEIAGKGAGKGFDDGFTHMAGTEKMLSIEFLSGGKTVNFGNFYRISGAGRHELRNYYEGEFERMHIAVLKKEYTISSDIYMLKGKNAEMVINISGQYESGDMIIFIMG